MKRVRNILVETANSYFAEWGGEDTGSSRVAELVDSWIAFYQNAGYEEELADINVEDLIDDVVDSGFTSQDDIDTYLSAKYLGIEESKKEIADVDSECKECEEKKKLDEFSKINIPTKTVAEIGDEFDFVSDSQDVEAVKDYVGDDPQIPLDGYDSFFIRLNDAGDDYEEVWGMEGIVPNLDKTVERVYPKFYTEKKEEEKEEVTESEENNRGYVAFYKGKRHELYAPSKYEAQKKAAEFFKAKKAYDVTVELAEVDGEEVVHTATESTTPKKPTLAEGLRSRAYEILAEENDYLSI